MDITYNQKMNIFLSSIPFVKDSLEWRRVFYALKDHSEKNNMKFDYVKMLYIVILSLESILKAIVILEFPEEILEKKTIRFLQGMSHNLIKIYNKIELWFKEKDWIDLGKYFSNEEKLLIERWSKYAKDIKYKMDAFVTHWLDVKWLSLLAWQHKNNDSLLKDFELFERIQWKLIYLWKIISLCKYWKNEELAYITSLNEESILKIWDEDFNKFKDMFVK